MKMTKKTKKISLEGDLKIRTTYKWKCPQHEYDPKNNHNPWNEDWPKDEDDQKIKTRSIIRSISNQEGLSKWQQDQ